MYDAVLDVLPYGIVFFVAFCAMFVDTVWVCALAAIVAIIACPLVTIGIVDLYKPDIPVRLTIVLAVMTTVIVALIAEGCLQYARSQDSVR